jgi:hypothetical protein
MARLIIEVFTSHCRSSAMRNPLSRTAATGPAASLMPRAFEDAIHAQVTPRPPEPQLLLFLFLRSSPDL